MKNCTFNIEGNILDNLIQKQPCDNILKAKRRHKKEKEEKALLDSQNKMNKNNNEYNEDKVKINKNIKEENKNNNENNVVEEINNLNVNLINKDNNDDNNWNKEEDKDINYVEMSDIIKNKKRNSDEYKEEDIVSRIAITEFSADKNDTFDTFSIRENSNLNIINEDINK